MNFEVVKTYILTILVLTSLLLTFALWNYQPNLEPLYGNYVNEVDLGGKEEIKRSLIKPSTIVFRKGEQQYGFITPLEGQRFYQEVQDWLLSDYKISETQGRPTNDYYVEIVFPNVLPVKIITSLFNINEEDPLPNWSFQRMFILLNEETSSLQIKYLSIDGHQQVTYDVNKPEAFATLLSYVENTEQLTEYIPFDSKDKDTPIYLPKDPLEIKNHSLAIRNVDETLLIDDLFKYPSLISPNFGGSYFTDGQRRLSVLQEGRTMEFINPIHSKEKLTDAIQLLELSITKINEHKGWTNDFQLVDINISEEIIRYRMFYEGYPIFSGSDLSIIEQEWRNQDLHLYRRPLFSINNLPGGKTIELASGTEVINYLTNNENYELSNVKDIQIGYKITSFDDASYSLTIDPAWYMNYNGAWLEIRVNELDEFIRGGS